MDIVRFQDAESAEAALVAFAGHPIVVAFESMLDPNSLRMTHWWAAKVGEDICVQCPSDELSVVRWNDSAGRTQQDVLAFVGER